MKNIPLQKTFAASATADVLAILVAALPIVYRISAILRELKPDIEAWLRSATERNLADRQSATEIQELLDSFTAIAERLTAMDERQQHHSKLQDEALATLLRRLCEQDDEQRSQ